VFAEKTDMVLIDRDTADVGVQRLAFRPFTPAADVPYLYTSNQLLKIKGRHLYTASYMNMTSSGLQCEVAY